MSSRHLTLGTLSHPQRTGDASPLYILYIHIVYNLNTIVKHEFLFQAKYRQEKLHKKIDGQSAGFSLTLAHPFI